MSLSHPKNVIRYCPRCGSSHFSYCSDQSFICESCQFHLYVNSAAAVAAILINEENEILLTRRAVKPHKGMLDLPGGFVDPMESAEEALVREVKEELNLELVDYTYLMSSPNEYVFGGLSVFTTDLAYICKVKSFQNIHAKDDIDAFEFYPMDSVPLEEIGGESIRRIIERFIATEVQNGTLKALSGK